MKNHIIYCANGIRYATATYISSIFEAVKDFQHHVCYVICNALIALDIEGFLYHRYCLNTYLIFQVLKIMNSVREITRMTTILDLASIT